MDSNFVVYMHFVEGESDPFYIGEGREKRSKSRFSRNRYWNFVVAKHGGFRVEIVASGLTKADAEQMERKLIAAHREREVRLTNICDGTMFDSHWLAGKPKESHPSFGLRFEAPWIAESNARRAGRKMQPRPDLVERNKLGKAAHFTRAVRCIETGETFASLTKAGAHVGSDSSKIHRAVNTGCRARGFHWEYVDADRSAPKVKVEGASTVWRHGKLPTTTGGVVPFINVK